LGYEVQLSAGAERELSRLSTQAQIRIARAIRKLAESPRHTPGIKKLRGDADAYRVRVGDYRVLYKIDDKRRLVLVVRAGHRRDVYRGR
jgi:mRNA interferase RelE/StbE